MGILAIAVKSETGEIEVDDNLSKHSVPQRAVWHGITRLESRKPSSNFYLKGLSMAYELQFRRLIQEWKMEMASVIRSRHSHSKNRQFN